MILSKEFILPNTTEIFDKVRKPIISSPSGCFIIYLFQGIKSSYCKRLLILALNIIPELKGRLLTVKNKNVLGLKLCSGHFCFCEKQQQQQQKKKRKKKKSSGQDLTGCFCWGQREIPAAHLFGREVGWKRRKQKCHVSFSSLHFFHERNNRGQRGSVSFRSVSVRVTSVDTFLIDPMIFFLMGRIVMLFIA